MIRVYASPAMLLMNQEVEFNVRCILLLSNRLSFSSLFCSFMGVDSSLHRSIKTLQRLKIDHLGTLNAVWISTCTRFLEFFKTQRQAGGLLYLRFSSGFLKLSLFLKKDYENVLRMAFWSGKPLCDRRHVVLSQFIIQRIFEYLLLRCTFYCSYYPK